MVRRQELPEGEDQGVTDFLITSRDLVEVGMCFSGQREWFHHQGFDIRAFVKDGMMASRFAETGDGLGLKAVELVRRKNGL